MSEAMPAAIRSPFWNLSPAAPWTSAPRATARIVEAMSAAQPPTRTAHFGFPWAVIVNSAICVLSPSSARKVIVKAAARVFQSMGWGSDGIDRGAQDTGVP